jgi:predicted acyltransferase
MFNAYGNPTAGVARSSPGEWHPQATVAMTVVSFLDVEKYPASLQFLLMTIGPSLILLALLDRISPGSAMERLLHPLLVFGRVPLFFYIAHLYLIHLLAVILAAVFHQPVRWLLHGAFWMNPLPDGYGHGLGMIYAVWITAVAMLYFPCAWFADLKQRRKLWWLSYL